MNVFYEEEGDFKIGAILADQDSSLQVEAVHGKRSKVKAAQVLFRFDEPLSGFMDGAQQLAQDVDIDFLWEVCGQNEFAFDTLARDYFGGVPTAAQSAAILLRLHGAPMYFYKKGKGRYKPAPPDALKAALASIERKRQQALLQARYVEQLSAGQLPEEFKPRLNELLYKPDRNTLEVKALEQAAQAAALSAAHLLEKCGAIPSSHDYHLNRFLLDYFPRGIGFDHPGAPALPEDLPVAEVEAFSIDDITTTEIDDAFSVRALPQGGWEVGVHIAAPALGIALGSPLDQEAAARMSTVYMPGGKITMLPEPVIAAYTLGAGRAAPAVSLYLDVATDYSVRATRSCVERVRMAANLHHEALEAHLNEERIAAGARDFAFADALVVLAGLTKRLEAERGRPDTMRAVNLDYNFYVADDRVRIVERRRGSVVDRVVAELMIYINAHWGGVLAAQGMAAIYRAQTNGKTRMTTQPAPHQGLGVAQYAWASSPLRRYVDLINQRQLIAWIRGETPAYALKSEALLTAMRDFELAYEAYAEFQRTMERYWCLRWLLQEGVVLATAQVMKEDLAKIGPMPLLAKVPGVSGLAPGTRIRVEVGKIDLLDLTLHVQYRGPLDSAAA